jgi:hypothetical protein
MICAPAPPRGNDIAAQIVTVYRSIFIGCSSFMTASSATVPIT